MKKGKTVYTFLMLIFVIGCCPPAAYYTVVFNSNNGTGDIATQTFLISVDQALDLNTFTRIGYTFTEWNTGANGSGNSYADGEIVNNLAIANSSVVILYAQWKPVIDNSSGGNNGNGNNTNNDSGGNGNGGNNNNPSGATYYTVMFDCDGGSTVATQTVEHGKTATYPAKPVKEGYTFDGWYYNDGSKFDFSTQIKNDIVLIAHWSASGNNNNPTTYTVTFDSDGGSTVDTQTVEHGKIATTPTEPTKDGYIFIGWYYDGSKFDFSTQIKSNITLTAHWSQVTSKLVEVYASKLSSTDLAKDSFGDTYTIQLCGKWTYEKLRALGSKIKDIPYEKRITLDMTQATGITSLYDTSYWEDGTFYGCHTLTSVLLPDTLKTINNYAFNQCYNLESITIPDSVKSIGYEAFNGCSALTSVTIPDSVESIGYDAFFGCYNLESATIPSSVTSISNNPFRYCSRLTSLTVSEGNTAYKSSQNCIYTKNGKELIAAAGGLTNVTIDNSVTSIGNYAFSGCSNLESVIIPNSVISIDYGAFENCSSLTSVTIGNSVTYIGGDAFRDCYKLENIIIPDNVENIDYGAFYNCTSLESVTIGSGVISIGGYAFRDCRKLISVIIPDSVESIGYDAFENCTSLTNVTIGNGVTYIGSSAFSRCSSLENITIGNSVTNIDQMAFYGCRELTSVTIPGSVTDINSHAFWNCTALATINFAGTMEQWENVTKGDGWNSEVPATKVVCSDGEVTLG